MGFRELDLRRSYISYGDDNISKAFLVPALMHTKLYRRSVGFFSSSVIASILDGIVALARNDGKIQLIASPNLSAEDVNAINLGYKMREQIIKNAFEHDFSTAMEELDDSVLQLLATLIADGILDIKIAVTSNAGIYHDKLGILEDFEGNIITFYGSSNSTLAGYQKNYEKIRLVKSWVTTELESIEDECAEFDALWNGTNPYVETFNYTASAVDNILKITESRKTAAAGKNEPIKLRDYQKAAIDAWCANNYHGFYVMATGTGKTWTAIYSALELLKTRSAMVVICAPYKHLVRQWAEDVAKAAPDAKLIMVSSENQGWEDQLNQEIVRQRMRKDTQIIVISTITSFNLKRFQQTLCKSKQEKLLIVDEAHRFTKRPDVLNKQFQYMLGLSATPFSGKNTAKGIELMKFFGGQVFDLPIEGALDRGFLVKYYYHPIFVYASADEEERFQKKSAQMAACFKNGVCIDPESLALHHRARLRIISMAEEKLERINEILCHVREKDHLIVYCGDGKLYDNNNEEIRHINFAKRALIDCGYKPSQFTASENMVKRMELVDLFNEGAIDALVAIRCLDEGINIPSIQGALILSSNDDYREFVQRRGRILRVDGVKKYANIYDVIVLPSIDTKKMAEIEFRRFYEYARLAENSDTLLPQLEHLAADYGLEIDDFVTIFDDEVEGELDD